MLFNKNANGIDELRNHIGFLYKANKFEDIASDLQLAHEEMELIVGNEIMQASEAHYHSDAFQANEQTDAEKLLDKLVDHLQLPISLIAYKDYAVTNDLSHDSSGRKMVLDPESEKIPFEWLLERDDQAILNKAHRTTDRLIKFLDDNIDNTPIKDTWAVSEAYALSKECFINTAREFDSIFPIQKSRRFFLAILPLMKEKELLKIRPIIGAELFNTLKEKIKDKDLTSEDKSLLQFIKVPLVLLTMRDAIKRLSVEILPNGVFQNYTSDRMTQNAKQAALANAKTAVIASLDADIKEHLSLLQAEISKLNTDPETDIEEKETSVDLVEQKFLRL